MDCIFCKIAKGDLPCHRLYEDEEIISFLDISPIAPGHALVLPKKHFSTLEDIDEATLVRLYTAVKKIGGAIKLSLDLPAYNVSQNNGPEAGQVVPHIHVHIIPRKAGDGLRSWPEGKYQAGEMEMIANKISSKLK